MSTNVFIIYTIKKVWVKNRIFKRFLPYMLYVRVFFVVYCIEKNNSNTRLLFP